MDEAGGKRGMGFISQIDFSSARLVLILSAAASSPAAIGSGSTINAASIYCCSEKSIREIRVSSLYPSTTTLDAMLFIILYQKKLFKVLGYDLLFV